MHRSVRTLAVLVSVVAVVGLAEVGPADAAQTSYSSCAKLQKDFKHGVSKSKAAAQKQVRQGYGMPARHARAEGLLGQRVAPRPGQGRHRVRGVSLAVRALGLATAVVACAAVLAPSSAAASSTTDRTPTHIRVKAALRALPVAEHSHTAAMTARSSSATGSPSTASATPAPSC